MPPKIPVIPGAQYGRWRVLAASGARDRWGKVMVLCRCVCGTEGLRKHSDLRFGESKSCGCWNREARRQPGKNRKHGDARTGKKAPEYRIWSGMKARCQNSPARNNAVYGARGIRVCERWLTSYETFLLD